MNISELLETQYTTVEPYEGINRIERRLHTDSCVVVIDHDRFYGILTPADIVRHTHRLAIDCLTEKPVLRDTDTIDTALTALKDNHAVLPVFNDDSFVGLISPMSIAESLIARINQWNRRFTQSTPAGADTPPVEAPSLQAPENGGALLTSAVESSGNPVVISDLRGKITYTNAAFLSLWGYPAETDMTGRSVVHFWDNPDTARLIVKHLRKKDGWRGVTGGQRKNGESFSVMLSADLVLDGNGEPVAIMSSYIDVTEQEEALKKSRENEHIVHALINSTDEAMFLTDSDGIILVANAALARRFGQTTESIAGRNIFSFLSGDLTVSRKRYVEEVLKCGKPVRFRDTRDGLDLENTYYPVFDANGSLRKMAVFSRDITSHNKLEKAFRTSERLYEVVVETANEAILIADADGRITFANRNAAAQLGYQYGDLTRKRVFDLVDGGSREKLAHTLGLIRTSNRRCDQLDILFRKRDGGPLWGLVNISPLIVDTGSCPGGLLMISDITSRKRAEEKLHLKERAIACSMHAMGFIDRAGNIIYVNDTLLKIWEYTSFGELAGKSILSLWDDNGDGHTVLETLQRAGKAAGTITARKNGGEVFPVSYSFVRITENIPDDSGTPVAAFGSFTDISRQVSYHNSLEDRIQIELLINEISKKFITIAPEDTDTEINAVLALIGTEIDMDRVYIFRTRGNGILIDNTHEWCRKGIEPQIGRLQNHAMDSTPWFFREMKRNGYLYIESVDSLPDSRPVKAMLLKQKIQSLLAVPMILQNRFTGFVGFDSVRQVRKLDHEDITVLMMLSDIFVNAFERQRTDTLLKNQQKHLEELFLQERNVSNIAMTFNAVESIDEAIPSVLDIISREAGVENVCLSLITGRQSPYISWSTCNDVSGKGCSPQVDCFEARFLDPEASERYIVLNGGEQNIRDNDCPLLTDTTCAVFYPVRIRDTFLGILAIIYACEHAIRESDHQLHETYTNIIASAGLRNLHFQEALEAERSEKKAMRIADQASRLASLGTLAAGITHEINQPLSGLKVIVDSILYWNRQGKMSSQEKLLENLELISQQAERIDDIIKHIRLMAKNHTEEEPDHFSVDSIVNSVVNLVQQRLAAHNILITYDPSAEPVRLSGYRTHYEQILSNLVINAMQALDTLDTENKIIEIETYRSDHNHLVLRVADNGPGVPDDIAGQIFDPFFTTKKGTDSMGLGLFIITNILKTLNGSISQSNCTDGGAVFIVTVPIR